MKSRWLAALALITAVAGAGLWLWREQVKPSDWAAAPAPLQALLWPVPRPVADFELRTQEGNAFRSADLRAHWSLLYFGYLQCPDVCPTTMQSLQGLRKLLTKADPKLAANTQFIFVSVDPGNDTPERISAYLDFFGDGLVGLSGDPAQLAQLASSLGVMYAEFSDPQGTRSMDHTTSIIIVDPHGRGVAALPAPHQPTSMLEQFQSVQRFVAD
jgi:protein SCO1/2